MIPLLTGIRIPVNSDEPVHRVRIYDFYDYLRGINGFVERMDLINPPLTLFQDEDRIEKELPRNNRATVFSFMHRQFWKPVDLIYGEVLIMGPLDEDGEIQDVPLDIEILLCETIFHKFEILDGSNTWVEGHGPFADWVIAYQEALATLVEAGPENIRAVRVVPA